MSKAIRFWHLDNFDLFKRLPKQELMRLCELLEMEHVKKGDHLHTMEKEGEKHVYFIKTGIVKVVDGNDSELHTKYLLKAGNLFGELALFDDTQPQERAIAAENSLVCKIEDRRMKQLMQNYPNLNNAILKFAGLRIKRLESQLSQMLYKDSYARIRDFIVEYIKHYGETNEEKYEARNFLSHQDIANLTHTSRQTVSNVLSTLRKKGIIDYDRKTIRLVGNPN